MKQKIGPAAIAVAVVVLAGFMYLMYKVAFQSQSPEASPANAPAYVKAAGGTPGMAAPAANGQAASPPSPAGPPDYANTYREGGRHNSGGGGFRMGGPR
jgi:hypothetical protein